MARCAIQLGTDISRAYADPKELSAHIGDECSQIMMLSIRVCVCQTKGLLDEVPGRTTSRAQTGLRRECRGALLLRGAWNGDDVHVKRETSNPVQTQTTGFCHSFQASFMRCDAATQE